MSQRFVKGLTNNHLTWVMVDATDFATPESNVEATQTIKIYGKLRGQTTHNFLNSGTGSLTNSIFHVGPSATGVYTIALAKADLSDASAAWYDQYIIVLAAAGCAQQVLVVDGGIVESALLALSDAVSNVQSYLVVMSGVQSDIYSLLSDTRSTTDSQFAVTSNYLSNASNYLSYISAVVSGLGAGQSASAIADKVWSDYQSKVGQSPSQVYSNISNMLSYLSATVSDFQSDFQSRVPKAVATNSQLSDLHSDLRSYLVEMSGMLSNTHSAAILGASAASDAHSAISDLRSAFLSAFIDERNSTVSATGNASTLEIAGPIDHENAFNGHWIKLLTGSQADELRLIVSTDKTNSRITVKPAFLSAVASGVDYVILGLGSPYLSQIHSDIQSRFSDVSSKVVALAATFDLSDIQSHLDVIQNNIDNGFTIIDNAVSDLHSDFRSRVPKAVATNSQLSDLHSDLRSYLVGMSGAISDVDSALNSQFAVTSNYLSNASNYLSNISATLSDVRSDVSDLHSDLIVMSGILSDVASAITVVDSRVLLTQSAASNADSIVQLLNTAQAEPTGVPAANASPLTKLGFLYEALRNKLTVTSTKLTFFDDAEVAQWEKDLSDDGTTYAESEGNAI